MVFQKKSTVIFLLISCIIATISCNSNNNDKLIVSVDVKAMPTIRSTDVSMLMSDSGVTRNNMKTKVWEIYSKADEPYWYFPEGVNVERFDSLFQAEGSIQADTAYFFENKSLWHAIGNVVAVNKEGTVIETSELFWHEKAPAYDGNAIYSNKLVKITNPDGTFNYGNGGFRSNQALNPIYIFKLTGEFNIEESKEPPQAPIDTPQQQPDSSQKPIDSQQKPPDSPEKPIDSLRKISVLKKIRANE